MEILKLQRVIIDALEDVKAQDIRVFSTTHLTGLFDRVVVASGTSNRQTKALANSVRESVKEAGGDIISTEGEETGEWVLVDCGDAVVHIMQPALRQYYNLEEIWGDKPVRVKLGADGPRSARHAEEVVEDEPVAPSTTKPAAKKAPARKVIAKAGAKIPAKTSAKTGAKPAAKAPAAKKAPARKPGANAPARKTSPRSS
jgi:ribosome-associated protein